MYVGDALESLRRQFDDIRELELVVVDDGSTDATLDIVEERADWFPNITVLRNELAHGCAAARNQAMDVARGRFISFLDADDWFAPGHLASLVFDIERIGCDFLRTDVVFTLGRERTIRRAPQARRHVALKPRESVLPVDETTMVDHPWTQAGLYDRRLADSGLLRFDAALLSAEDRPWIWGLHLKADSFSVVDAPGFIYRRGVSASLTQVVDERRLSFLHAFEQVRDLVEGDVDAERFMPKVVQTVLALTANHLLAYDRMTEDVQRRFADGARSLIASLPDALVADALASLPVERQERLALVVEVPGEAVAR